MTLAIPKQTSVLRGMVTDNPAESISRLPLLTTAERERLLVEWNDTYAEYPKHRCVHQLFEEQVGRTPDATALVFETQELSYRELNSRANQLAHQLLKLGVGPDSLVGICVQRSPDMIAGLLGIWKAGGAYVPLDPQYPLDRLSFMVEDSGLNVLITEKPLRPKFSGYKGELICVDEATCKERSENCFGGARPENLAYVIYTSGSTGKPKGVQICHKSLVNFLSSMRSSPGLAPEDSLLAVTTISFDIAALELYLPLIVGARLVLASRETAVDGYKLQKTLAGTATTVMQATPATWRLLLEAGWQGSNNFKILCGGEGLPRDLAVELLKRGSSVWNMYGPTETTVWSTTSRITADDSPTITIGRPIANTEVYVLDDDLEPVQVGTPGELYIGGAGVARGYLHRPELTAEKFIIHPFRDRESGARLYRTGDLARFRENGELECLGRIDNQVKVRGFRIELGEIESVLSQFPGVKESVVVAREDTPGDKRLVAYVTYRQAQSVEVDALREFLKKRLPDYMLPSQFVSLEALPLTPNGKVDRRALPAPQQLQLTPQSGHVAARNDIESRLVKIWESVLNIRPVGIKENFFDLGGHSLLVAKLLRRIEHSFGKKLSMAAIFEAPTVEQQADVLGNSSALRWPSALAPIQPGGSRPPFFCFGFGAGPVFRSLAGRVGPDQPLLGVDPGLLEGSQVPEPYSMEDVAACLAKQMREVQPNGPYYLGGICGGGLVAYATASQLMAQGQQVALLALFEPHPSHHDYFVEHSNGFGRGRLSQRVKFHIENLQTLKAKEGVAYARDHIRERSRILFNVFNGLVEKTVKDLRPRMLNRHRQSIGNILGPATRNYRPQPFPGPVALFQATHREPGGEWERQYWTELAPKLVIHEVPGYSNWIVRFFLEPNVEILASKLRAYLPGHRTPASEG